MLDHGEGVVEVVEQRPPFFERVQLRKPSMWASSDSHWTRRRNELGCSMQRSTRREMKPGAEAMIDLARSMVSMNAASCPGMTGRSVCSVITGVR